MRLKGDSYVFIALVIIMLLVIIQTLMMTSFITESLPLIVSSIGLVLAAAGLWRSITHKNVLAKPEAAERAESKDGNWKGYLTHAAWIVGFVIGIHFLGFLVAIFLFTLAYMRRLGTGWPTSIISAVATLVITWALFELTLKMELWRGVILEWLVY